MIDPQKLIEAWDAANKKLSGQSFTYKYFAEIVVEEYNRIIDTPKNVTLFSTKRDGKTVWPYCVECGCQLNVSYDQDILIKSPSVYHFLAHWHNDEDLAGHKCKLLSERKEFYNLDEVFDDTLV